MFRIEFKQYNINWQQNISYQISISANTNCVFSSWTRFLTTLKYCYVQNICIYNVRNENISSSEENKILTFQNIWRYRCVFFLLSHVALHVESLMHFGDSNLRKNLCAKECVTIAKNRACIKRFHPTNKFVSRDTKLYERISFYGHL